MPREDRTINAIYDDFLPDKSMVTHYLFKVNDSREGNINDVFNQFFNPTWLETIQIGDLTNAIVSFKAYPFSLVGELTSSIPLDLLGKRVLDNVYALKLKSLQPVIYYTLSKNTFINDFTDYPPYSTLLMYLPFKGYVELNPYDVNDKVISVVGFVDLTDGSLCYYIINETDERIINTFVVQVAIDIPVAAQNQNVNNLAWLKTISNALEATISSTISGVQAGISAFSGDTKGVVKGATQASQTMVKGLFDTIWGAYDATRPNIANMQGAQGNLGWCGATSIYYVKLKNKLTDSLDSIAKIYGRPLLKYKTDTERKELQGRTKYRSVHISCGDMTTNEIDMLNDILTSGFTIE